jgi:filamentous hemagglutinin
MPDGRITTIDNTRVAAARETGTTVQARVHPHDAPIDPARAPTLANRRTGEVPETWGQGVENRIAGQSSGWRRNNPMGSDDMPRMRS